MYMCDCNCFLFCVKNMCVDCINVIGLKLKFDIRVVIGFRGDFFVAKGLS
jgi:hypothetical protein